MLSILRKDLIYNNISSDIVEHDLDVDADQWSYDGKDVYRGSVDPEYLSKGLNVYWLYDDNLKRIGLVEHETKEPEVYKALWFRENPWATYWQNDDWKSTETTLWSKLSNEAYQDYLEGMDIYDMALQSGLFLCKPSQYKSEIKLYTCEKCNKKSLMAENSCPQASVSILDFPVLCVDDDLIIYQLDCPSLTQPQSDACAESEQKAPQWVAEPEESAGIRPDQQYAGSPPQVPDSQEPATQ